MGVRVDTSSPRSPFFSAPTAWKGAGYAARQAGKGDFLNFAKYKTGAPNSAGNCAERGSFYFSQLGIATSTHSKKKKKTQLL